MFERVREQLIARLNETKLNISDLTGDKCNKALSEVSAGSWEDAFDHALGINETALLKTKKMLEQLEAKIGLMKSNLTKINNNMHYVTETMSKAEQIRETAKTTAANAVADVLRSLVREMCASATELHELQKKNNGLEAQRKLSRITSQWSQGVPRLRGSVTTICLACRRMLRKASHMPRVVLQCLRSICSALMRNTPT
ncbi:hypothetical protein ERJ75_000155800 [Trypanosoma vivax]|nr:hypothetical protein ERJ75_000155800 [Trypanosoma vivax]